jgi:hypothetical protein
MVMFDVETSDLVPLLLDKRQTIKFNWYRKVLSLGLKRPGCEHHTPSSSVDVKNQRSRISTRPVCGQDVHTDEFSVALVSNGNSTVRVSGVL